MICIGIVQISIDTNLCKVGIKGERLWTSVRRVFSYGIPGGLLKYDFGRDVPLRLEKMRPIFIPETQISPNFLKLLSLQAKEINGELNRHANYHNSEQVYE